MTPEEHQIWTRTYEVALSSQINRASDVKVAIQEAADAAHHAVAQYKAEPAHTPARKGKSEK